MTALTDAGRASLRQELERIVGQGSVLSDPDELLTYESDGLTLFRALADFVVFPRETAQVAAIVKLANREGLPFVARGAGTGLSGGCLPTEGGIVISLMRMNRVLEVDYENQIAVVQPGVVNLHLSWAVAPRGYYYAPDPSSQQACTIGGNIAENSGGPHTLKYGVTTNHVLGLEVVMPDGEVVWLGGQTRETPGYDLAGLFVGSEGTFGIATTVVVRILKKPQAVKTVLAVFDEADQASEAVSAVIARGLVPAAMEMIDQLTIQAVEDAFDCGYPRDAAAALLIELDGLAVGMPAQMERIVHACRDSGAREVRMAQDESERQLLWKGRKSAFGAYGRLHGDGRSDPTDQAALRLAPCERDRVCARAASGKRLSRRGRQSAPEHPVRSAQPRGGVAGDGSGRRDHARVRRSRWFHLRGAWNRARES
jgi:glycolate dehydrogenase FAD-linked subunit